jgi:2-keto-4-pentenoate hydratase/2-oxohepta-3-ene-1,7-dioic acid hydratase in catechol pathway
MKIICIGRNYREHIKELNSPIPSTPVFFLKPDTSLLIRNRPFFLPGFSKEIHYEAELVLKICKVGKNIQEKYAHTYFDQIGIGLDFTARDLQNISKQQGLPWLISKGFDNAAPIGKFLPKSQFEDTGNINFHLVLNGEIVQKANSSEMIFSFDDIIAYISHFITLKTGDLIFTGTPSGVGPVKQGDKLEAYIENERLLKCDVK